MRPGNLAQVVEERSLLEECACELLTVRRLADLELRVLPWLRGRLRLAALAVSVEVDGARSLLTAGEGAALTALRRVAGPGCRLALCTPRRGGEVCEAAFDGATLWSVLGPAGDRAALERVAPLVAATATNAAAFERLHRSAVTDPLTGLYNRRFFLETLERELTGARRDAGDLALLALDLDGFKRLNDRCGHAAGNRMLTLVADVLRKETRRADVAARVGGDEFLMLAAPITLPRAQALARRIERAVSALPAPPAVAALGVSIGVALARSRQRVAELLAAADAAMYQRKRDRRAGARAGLSEQ